MEIRISSKEQEELVLKNQGLVNYIVGKLNVHASDYEDVVSIGTIGLIKAAATFNKSKGISFATYASKCIHNEILMHFRKEKFYKKVISLNTTAYRDEGEQEIKLEDKIADPRDFTEEIEESEQNESFVKLISIILNLLEQKERLIMLYEIASFKQTAIAEDLNLSQSYISRMQRKINNKVKSYFMSTGQIKEVFKMTIEQGKYKIKFATKDVKRFNEIFANFLQNLTSTADLPDFKITCSNECIIIYIPAHPESFSFIAKIIREIDEFSMTFVSDKSTISAEKENFQDKKSNNTSMEESQMCINTAESENVKKIEETVTENLINEDSNIASTGIDINSIKGRRLNQRGRGKNKQIRDYILNRDSFTVQELKQYFKGFATASINNALMSAKEMGLITPTGRGKYVVNKN